WLLARSLAAGGQHAAWSPSSFEYPSVRRITGPHQRLAFNPLFVRLRALLARGLPTSRATLLAPLCTDAAVPDQGHREPPSCTTVRPWSPARLADSPRCRSAARHAASSAA